MYIYLLDEMRNYKRKSTRNNWEEERMAEAIRAVSEGTKVKKVAADFNIPRTTLRRRLADRNKFAKGSKKVGIPTSINQPFTIYRIQV